MSKIFGSSRFAGASLLAVSLAACGGGDPRIEVGDIQVQPSERIAVGGTAALTIAASGTGLAFQWKANRGRLSSESAASPVYTAPSTAGLDTVTVEVTGEGGSVVKSRSFEIVDKPALSPQNTPAPGQVTLTSHRQGQTVPCEAVAKGRYSSDVTAPIWPVVYVGGMYHPQDEGGKPASKLDSRDWYGTVRFGDCNNPRASSGLPFQLLVVTVDDAAHQAFESYLQEGRRTGKYPGLPELPEGVTRHAQIQVTRE